MKVIENFEKNTIACLLTTEGTTERYVIRGLAEKYNGKDKFLYFPALPIKVRTSTKYSVFNGILQMEKERSVKKYLILTDRDVWCSDDEIKKRRCKDKNLRDLVNKHIKIAGFKNVNLEERSYSLGVTYVVAGEIGNRKIVAYLCISGENKDIDENLSYLYYLKFGEKVEPEWKIIKSHLKRKDINLSTLIRQSGEKYLEKSLPHILYPIKDMDCESSFER